MAERAQGGVDRDKPVVIERQTAGPQPRRGGGVSGPNHGIGFEAGAVLQVDCARMDGGDWLSGEYGDAGLVQGGLQVASDARVMGR